MQDSKRTIEILEEAAYAIHSIEYASWSNANTMRSQVEWRRGSYSEILYKKIHEEIKQLEENE